MSAHSRRFDVAIVGGGPGGSNTGCLLKKYSPALRVLILEKESFPRDHVGESQLPPISDVLLEMGCWDKVEAAGFPIKLGATYTWGKTTEPWIFGFLPDEQVPRSVHRPGAYEGWRRRTAFQVDRAVYDDIMLKHAAETGCEVRQATRVSEVLRLGDRIDGLQLDNGEVVTARYYIDASGNAGVLRRAMDVNVEIPTRLKNIAFWSYWEKPAWAREPDVDATRVHVRSLGFGWVWFIRLSPTRASIGVVSNGEYYRAAGQRPEDFYARALEAEPFVRSELVGATRTAGVEATTDWSFVVDRTYGENWFLVGECAGFADPILAAGLTLTQTGARELAYTILELERGDHDRSWLLERYDDLQRRRVRQHIRFAEYWYSSNGIFEDIRESCVEIARDAGLRLTPAQAFAWLSQGGLADDVPGQVGIGGLDVAGVKQVMQRFSGSSATWSIDGKNVFKLNLSGATQTSVGLLRNGRIQRAPCYERAGFRLPCVGVQGMLVDALKQSSDISAILESLRAQLALHLPPEHIQIGVNQAIQALEVLVNDYWVTASHKKGRAALNVGTPAEGSLIHSERHAGEAVFRTGAAG